jgi:xanthine/CO dehydrogenase XdhC/CoxF family maturation factor
MIHDAAGIRLGTHAQPPPGSAALFAAVARGTATGTTCAVDVVEDGRRVRALLQQLAPPPLLLVCGAGPDAQPVVGAARSLGWRVAVVDHRPAYAAAERFPGATVHCAPADSLRHTIDLARCHAAVVMSHHLVSDTAYLRALAAAGMPGYVGLLGPAARRGRLAADLGDAARLLEHRLRGPVGVDIGAATPEGIALSIIAQVHAWLAGRAAGDAGTAGLALQESAK